MGQQLLNTQNALIRAELEEYLTCGEASKPRGKYKVWDCQETNLTGTDNLVKVRWSRWWWYQERVDKIDQGRRKLILGSWGHRRCRRCHLSRELGTMIKSLLDIPKNVRVGYLFGYSKWYNDERYTGESLSGKSNFNHLMNCITPFSYCCLRAQKSSFHLSLWSTALDFL